MGIVWILSVHDGYSPPSMLRKRSVVAKLALVPPTCTTPRVGATTPLPLRTFKDKEESAP